MGKRLGSVFGASLLVLGCSGGQTGDSGEGDLPLCNYEEAVLVTAEEAELLGFDVGAISSDRDEQSMTFMASEGGFDSLEVALSDGLEAKASLSVDFEWPGEFRRDDACEDLLQVGVSVTLTIEGREAPLRATGLNGMNARPLPRYRDISVSSDELGFCQLWVGGNLTLECDGVGVIVE